MSEMVMPTENGTEVGQMHFGLPGSPHLCTHVWTGREWRPMLTDEDILRAEIKRLKAENEKLARDYKTARDAYDAAAQENVRLRTALARISNEINVVGSPYHKALNALDELIISLRREARAALTQQGGER